ncbi:MAG: ECF-type sigma factor [Pirellulaceae bacterium]
MNEHPSRQPFRTTHWSVVLHAGGGAGSVEARRALSQLCEIYWAPLYTFLRRDGHSRADSEDIVQSFLAMLIERDDFANLQPDKGRFRSFLLASLKHFVSNRRDHDRAAKRGGGATQLSLCTAEIEQQLDMAANVATTDPDVVFDRQWAVTVLEHVQQQLIEEQPESKRQTYRHLMIYLTIVPSAPSYQEMADRLSMSSDAIKMTVSRMRSRFRQLLRNQIAQTVDAPDEIEDEIRYLISALR